MTEPTGYTAVGMVGFTDKGTYSASVSYVKNDLVHYGGSIWCCLIDDTVGITPTEGVNWRFWVENSQNGISDIVNILGAKNLLKVSATTTTINGVTFTVNSDDSITVNGTATAKAVLALSRQDFGTAYISTAQGGTTSTSEYIISGLSRNNDLYLSYNAQTTNIVVQSGYTADNVRIYPMIRPKNIEDGTWRPYAKTNKELTSDIQTLTNKLNSIPTKRRYILIGDSYGYGISPDYTSETGKGWIDWFTDTVGDTNDVYFADVSVLQGVAGFASSMSFLSMLQTLDSVITNKKTITDIVVMGGANDVAWNNVTKTAIENAIESFCAYCHNNYPNAHVKIGVLCANLNLMLNDTADTYKAYKTCTLHGAEFIDDALNAYVAPAYISSDGTHLTQSGYEHYAPVTNNLIISGHADYVEDFVVGLTLDNTLISLSDQQTTKINLTGRISADNIILNMRNQQNNSCAFRILDRSISYAAGIASAFTLDTPFNLPLYNEMSGGNIYIRKPSNSNECNIGGAFRIFQNASDKLTVQLSAPIGNWHVNDSDYQMVCVIECSHACIIPY